MLGFVDEDCMNRIFKVCNDIDPPQIHEIYRRPARWSGRARRRDHAPGEGPGVPQEPAARCSRFVSARKLIEYELIQGDAVRFSLVFEFAMKYFRDSYDEFPAQFPRFVFFKGCELAFIVFRESFTEIGDRFEF